MEHKKSIIRPRWGREWVRTVWVDSGHLLVYLSRLWSDLYQWSVAQSTLLEADI